MTPIAWKTPFKISKRIWLKISQQMLLLRVKKVAVSFLGVQYRPNSRRIEIDITHYCQLKCHNCNRSCRQAPTERHMTLGQIEKFIEESKRQARRWESITVMGGEPTCHPQFHDIVAMLLAYKKEFSPETSLVVKSNGYGDETRNSLARVPAGVIVGSTDKKGPVQQFFLSFNVAPVDLPAYAGADYTNGCWICADFGIGLTHSGYYPCAVAGGIDRVMGFNRGRKNLPLPGDDMKDELRLFCRYCGHFKRTEEPAGINDVSPTWEHAYEAYRDREPVLSLY